MAGAYSVRLGAGYTGIPQPRAADPARVHNLAGRTMGTSWSLRLDNPRLLPLQQVNAAIEAAFGQVIAQMSTWEADSDICRFGRAAPDSWHSLAPEFARVLDCALHWAQVSGGAIDPTVGPLIGLWGFGARASLQGWPDDARIDAARRQVDWRRLERAGTSTLRQPGGVELDFSGIAKGFAVDHACEALLALGLGDFLLEVGGEVRACGARPDGAPWRISIEAADGAAWHLPLRDVAIATSGDRWHTREAGTRRWSHTIDPRSGLPVAHPLAAVSVLHAQCMHADALATLLTVLGPDEGLRFATAQEVAALFVVRNHDGSLQAPIASPGWHARTAAA